MSRFLVFLVFVLFVWVVPDVSLAQGPGPGGFVNCNGTDCSACNLVQLVNTIIIWLFGVIAMIFAVLMVVAGFGLVTSGGNQSALEAAKSKFTNAIIGVIIVMAAWLLVDNIMRAVVGGGSTGVAAGELVGWGPWSEVKCQIQLAPEVGELPEAKGNPPDPTMTAECTDDAALMAKYKGSPVGLKAPGLDAMISCYLSDPTVDSLTDRGQLYTVDLSHPRCSLTNGHSVCEPCSHSANSMHYGRGSGQGAKAVDFNSKGSEKALFDALSAKKAACGGTLLFEGNHTHISM